MFVQIITHTPIWVWAVFVLLLWFGFKQSLPSSPGLKRITLIPLAMLCLSIYGVISVFGSAGALLLAWGSSLVLAATLIAQRPVQQGTHYNSWTQRFGLPGSWVPLLLMMGIFMTKYGVGITAAMRPDLLHSATFSYSICAVYGVCSGVFAGRALRLWGLVWSQANSTGNLKGA